MGTVAVFFIDSEQKLSGTIDTTTVQTHMFFFQISKALSQTESESQPEDELESADVDETQSRRALNSLPSLLSVSDPAEE